MLRKYAPRLLVSHLTGSSGASECATCTRFDGVVLFIDIVESTTLTDEYARRGVDGAEQLAAMLDDYFGRIIEIALAHGGDVLRIDGDAVVVVWYPGCAGPAALAPPIAAACAALAMRDALRQSVVRERITLVGGSMSFIVVREAGGRGHYVVDGAPIRQLGNPSLRGRPGQIIVSPELCGQLSSSAVLARADCNARELMSSCAQVSLAPVELASDAPGLDVELRPFIPRVLVERTAAGQAGWTAEFRKLTAIYINLRPLEPAGQNVAERLRCAVSAISDVVNPVGMPITNIVSNDKGVVVQIACGLPPYAQEHSAVLAVQSAILIGRALAVIGITVAIGITTGRAFCAEVGSANRREYLSTGLVMAYAARLMQSANDEILCDEATARAAMGHAEFSEPRSVMLKGRAEPLVIRSVGALPRSSSALPMPAGPLFGRETELSAMEGWFANVRRGIGGIVRIEAEPGAGKTHLLSHIGAAAQRLGFLTAFAVASQIEETTAYFVWRTLLPELLRHDGDPAEVPPEQLRDRILKLVRDTALAPRIPLLEDVLPLQFATKGLAPEIKGPARFAGVVELLAEILHSSTAQAPAVIMIDDAHWLDESSARVVTALAAKASRTLVVIASRPVDSGTPSHVGVLLDAASERFNLSRLSLASIEAIIKERLGAIDVPVALVEFVQERSEGLPFFAEQLLYSLRDHGVLTMADGRCSVSVTRLPEFDTPDSVRELVVSRIDRLPPGRQLAMKVASAVGREFDAETLYEVHPLKEGLGPIEASLDRLTDAGFLSRRTEAGWSTFVFRHGIIQAVTYELLPYAQRRPLHKNIAAHLEKKHGPALAPHYASLAQHWELAAEAEPAIRFRIAAADIAAQKYANHDALNHLDRVDRLVAHFDVRLEAPDVTRCMRIRADACQELTRFGDAHNCYRRLAELERIRTPRTQAEAIAALVREVVIQALRRSGVLRSVSEGDAKTRDALAAHIYMRFAEHAYFTNDTLRLAHGTLASLNHAERSQALPEIVNASGGLALGLAAIGLLRWATYYRERSIALANSAGSPSAQGFAQLLACVHAFHAGDWERMSLHATRGADIWSVLGDRYRYQACLVLAAYRMIATGQYEDADRTLASWGEGAEAIESAQVRAWALAARAIVDLVRGRPPALAISRLISAAKHGELNPAESLLCNGIAAVAYLAAGDRSAALQAAEAGLGNITHGSPAMAGALLFSVPGIAETFILLAQDPAAVGRTRDEMLQLAVTSCGAAKRIAARNRICKPRASLLCGHLAGARGATRHQRRCYREALADATQLGLPLEQAMSHYALSQVMAQSDEREAHQHKAGEIAARLGVAWLPWQQLLTRHVRQAET